MNLKSKGARRTLAVACSTAVVAAGASFFASPASASGSLTLYPSATSVTTLNLGAATDEDGVGGNGYQLDAELAAATFGLRVTSATTGALKLKVTSAPNNGALLRVEQEANSAAGVPGAADTWTSLDTNNGDVTNPDEFTVTAGNRVFVTADTVGAYQVKFYEDVDGSGTLTGSDNVSSLVTINVKQPSATAGSTNWTPAIAAPSSLASGVPVPVTVDFSGLTLTDARGASGVGQALDNLIGIGFTGPVAGSPVAAAATSFGTVTSSAYLASGVTTGAGSLVSDVLYDTDGDGFGATTTALGSATTAAQADNGITALSGVTQTDVTGAVGTYSGYTAVKGGTSSVKYSTTGTGAAAGDPVYFTLTPSINASTSTLSCSDDLPDLTADGTLLATYGEGVKMYAVLANSSGVASLTVRSNDTTGDCPYYTVAARSNYTGGAAVTAATRTARYVVPKPADFAITNTSTELLPAVGTTSVTLKGSLTDQFGIAVAPLAADSQQASLTVDSTTTSIPASSGSFSYVYTPTTPPSSPTTTPISWSYTSATLSTTFTKAGTITWASNSPANAVTLNTPVEGAGNVKLSTSSTVNPGQGGSSTFGEVNAQVTGIVTGTSGAPMPYKKVTLSGSDGVYFSTASNGSKPLTKTVDVVTNASGQFSGAYAFFTKAGTASVTVTADGKTDTSTVTTEDSSDGYIVSVNDAFGMPGAISISGRVVDMFDNPVSGREVQLAVTPAGYGTVTASTVTTTTDGSFTGTFTANAGVKGDFTITATMENASNSGVLTSNPVASTTWATTAEISGLPDGQYKDTSKLTVGPIILSGPKSRDGAGFIRLIGVSNPNTSVEIYGRTAGTTTGLVLVDTVMSDSKGDFQSDQYITGTTLFVAKSNSQYSPSVTVLVNWPKPSTGTKKYAAAKITAKVLGKGRVKLAVNGSPNTKGTITLYQNGKKVKSWTSNAWGDGSLTVKTSRGVKTFKAVFSPSGYVAGSGTVRVNVR